MTDPPLQNGSDDPADSTNRSNSKRPRVAQACDGCRKKKIRCDGEKPTCTNCGNYKAECVYTQQPRKPRVVKKPRRSTNIGELEHRLVRIESLLESLAPTTSKQQHKRKRHLEEDLDSENDSHTNDDGYDDDEDDDTDNERNQDDEHPPATNGGVVGCNVPNPDSRQDHHPENGEGESWLQDENIPVSTHFIKLEPQLELDDNADMFSVSLTQAIDHFCTNGTIFALFTKNGMKWVSEKTGDSKVPERLSTVLRNIHMTQQMKLRPFVEDIQIPQLPDEGILDYAVKAIDAMPSLFSAVLKSEELQEIIDVALKRKKGLNGYSQMFLLYAALTLVTPFLVFSRLTMSHLGLTERQTWALHHRFSSNAMFYYHRTMLIGANMVALKALVIFIMGLQTTHASPIANLTPVAVRCAHEMGLHRWESCHGLTSEEANDRRALWWLVYVIDRDASMKVGRGPTIMDFDISMKYPDANSDSKLGTEAQLLVRLADLFKIWGLVYERLFSAQAASKPPSEIVKDVAYLDSLLTKWRENLPADIRPGVEIPSQPNPIPMCGILPDQSWHERCGLLHLHYCYHQLLSTVHRITAYHPSWIYLAANEPHQSQDCCASSNSNNNTNTNASPISNASPSTNGSINGRSSRLASKYGRLFASLDICVQSARSTIELVRMSRDWDQQYLWGTIFYAAHSFITLFIKCIARPRDMSTQYDVDLMKNALEIFLELDQRHMEVHESERAQSVTAFWSELYTVASEFVEKSRTQARQSPMDSSNTNQSSSASAASSALVPLAKVSANDTGIEQYTHQSLPVTAEYANSLAQARSPHPLASNQMSVSQLASPSAQVEISPLAPHEQQELQSFMAPSEDMFSNQGADASMAQSLYQVSSYFYSWDADFMVYPDMNVPANGAV